MTTGVTQCNMKIVRAPTEALVRRLAALPAQGMREAVLIEELTAMPPQDAVAVLADVLGAAVADRQVGDLVAISTIAAALGRLPYAVAAAIYEAAKAASPPRPEVARLLFSSTGEAPAVDCERYLPAERRKLTLGERKWLARGGRREILSQLLGDPDASVIRALLENPRLTEKDVVSLAARRPARADVLRALFASRWSARYHVKRALVMNPWTPSDIAVRLVPSLAAGDRRLVAADANHAPAVREAAALPTKR